MFPEPAFQNILHTASWATIPCFANGGGHQRLDDESWGLENLSRANVPEPINHSMAAIVGFMLGGWGWLVMLTKRRHHLSG